MFNQPRIESGTWSSNNNLFIRSLLVEYEFIQINSEAQKFHCLYYVFDNLCLSLTSSCFVLGVEHEMLGIVGSDKPKHFVDSWNIKKHLKKTYQITNKNDDYYKYYSTANGHWYRVVVPGLTGHSNLKRFVLIKEKL